eukprot:15479392-Alexandrium_andersonii.AAC.1
MRERGARKRGGGGEERERPDPDSNQSAPPAGSGADTPKPGLGGKPRHNAGSWAAATPTRHYKA